MNDGTIKDTHGYKCSRLKKKFTNVKRTYLQGEYCYECKNLSPAFVKVGKLNTI